MSARGLVHGFARNLAAMHRIALVLAVLATSLAPPALAHAQLGGPNVPAPLTEPPPPPPVDSGLEDEGLSSLQQLLIFVAAGLVLAVVGFVIVRDAKRAAPDATPQRKSSPATPGAKAAVGGGGAAATDTSASAVRARERQRAKRAKAKAKAARQQRKRNRPR